METQPIDWMAALGAVISIMLSIIAYFIRQLHANFRRVEQDVLAMKTTVEVIKSELKANYELLRLRIAFLERSVGSGDEGVRTKDQRTRTKD